MDLNGAGLKDWRRVEAFLNLISLEVLRHQERSSELRTLRNLKLQIRSITVGSTWMMVGLLRLVFL